MRSSLFFGLAAAVSAALACDSCYGPSSEVVHERLVRRMQPGASDATVYPKSPLEWGQLNFLHTVSRTRHMPSLLSADGMQTDTHGWLEGHIKEQNYGADWGDFASFSIHMQHTAGNLGVDLMMGMDSVMLLCRTELILTPSSTRLITMY
jgi:hypothetical protein